MNVPQNVIFATIGEQTVELKMLNMAVETLSRENGELKAKIAEFEGKKIDKEIFLNL